MFYCHPAVALSPGYLPCKILRIQIIRWRSAGQLGLSMSQNSTMSLILESNMFNIDFKNSILFFAIRWPSGCINVDHKRIAQRCWNLIFHLALMQWTESQNPLVETNFNHIDF